MCSFWEPQGTSSLLILLLLPAAVSCCVSESGNCQPRLNAEEDHHLTALQCFKWFPRIRMGGGIFIQIFKGFQGNSFRTKYFIKRKGKRGEDPNKIYTRRVVLRNLNEIMSLQIRKWPNSLLSPAHYFSSLSLLAILASFGWGHPEPIPPVNIFWQLHHPLWLLPLTLEDLTWPYRSPFLEGVSP